jgi:hypothetical protein
VALERRAQQGEAVHLALGGGEHERAIAHERDAVLQELDVLEARQRQRPRPRAVEQPLDERPQVAVLRPVDRDDLRVPCRDPPPGLLDDPDDEVAVEHRLDVLAEVQAGEGRRLLERAVEVRRQQQPLAAEAAARRTQQPRGQRAQVVPVVLAEAQVDRGDERGLRVEVAELLAHLGRELRRVLLFGAAAPAAGDDEQDEQGGEATGEHSNPLYRRGRREPLLRSGHADRRAA